MALVHLANDKSFECARDVSILDAARAAGLILEHSCRTGRCGTCKVRVKEGTTVVIGATDGLSENDGRQGIVLTCVSSAVGDVWLDAEDVSLLADFPSRTTPCRIEALDLIRPDVLRAVLRFPPKASPNFLPGQYVDVIAVGGLRRSYSIANRPAPDGKIELHIGRVVGGALSNYWFGGAKVNDLLRLDGPKGSFFLRNVTGLDLVFLATGTGIAPVKAILEGLARWPAAEMPRSVTVLWGGRHRRDLYWEPHIDGLDSVEYVPVLSRADDSWAGERGHVQHVLMKRKPNWVNTVVYACGSQAMIDSACSELTAAGLAARRFFSDAFVSSSITGR